MFDFLWSTKISVNCPIVECRACQMLMTYCDSSILDWRTCRWYSMLLTSPFSLISTAALISLSARTLLEDIADLFSR